MIETIGGQYTIKQILQDHWPAFAQEHGARLRHAITAEVAKVLACRDPQKQGYHLYRCPAHPEVERIVPHSCKSRFCSSCGKVMTDEWMARSQRELLDVEYYHVVFTMPDCLWDIFPYERRLLDILFDGAKQTVLTWCCEKKGYIPGIVCVLHTFGCILNFNPHIHMLLTAGGLSPDRTRWIRNEFIPWDMLKERWKGHVITHLKPKLNTMIRELRVGQEYLSLGTGGAFRRILG